ncbi:MAG: hypothetical protein EF806_01685 [Candidatus Methanoliparum thermophilum]|uniref:Uncharacterized protein n=1 Tax=Methanoliparum thermophilum TaxID=2491083 RepID=A0A520KTW6_METT2|nr:MAG: hypothetical protein EF806_01685 [Candidatus Methanoliparum thermophilum]
MNEIDVLKRALKKRGRTVPEDHGKINEEILKDLFKDFNIQKISESSDPSPDFEVTINKSNFILEAKLLEDIYIDFFELLYDTLKELGKESFLEEHNIVDIEPLLIHKKDVEAQIRRL